MLFPEHDFRFNGLPQLLGVEPHLCPSRPEAAGEARHFLDVWVCAVKVWVDAFSIVLFDCIDWYDSKVGYLLRRHDAEVQPVDVLGCSALL